METKQADYTLTLQSAMEWYKRMNASRKSTRGLLKSRTCKNLYFAYMQIYRKGFEIIYFFGGGTTGD
jgi:hypothetical protein